MEGETLEELRLDECHMIGYEPHDAAPARRCYLCSFVPQQTAAMFHQRAQVQRWPTMKKPSGRGRQWDLEGVAELRKERQRGAARQRVEEERNYR